MKTIHLLSGDEALARGAYEAGLKTAVSYPGTPATEILEYLAKFSEVDAKWSVNEKTAYEVALGASIAGVRSMYSSKHVGLNVAMDPLMTSAYTGINGGFAVVVADDPQLASSQNEQDNRLIAKFSKLPMLEPASPREAYEMAKAAFDISEKFDTPVIIRLTTRVSHTKENVEIAARKEVADKTFTPNAPKYVMVPGHAYKKHIALEAKLLQMQKFADESELNKIEINDKNIGIIADGVSYLYAKETFPNASFLKLGFSYPFPDEKIKQFAKEVKELYVIEELEPFIEEHVKQLGIAAKVKDLSYRVGELNSALVKEIIAGNNKKVEKPSGARKPVLCPGCSHRPVFVALKKLKAVVAGDIGCYTLGALKPLEALHTTVCMGASVTIMQSLSKVLGHNKVVGVIGDSTFVHSGITGLVDAAYNKTKGALIILDNSNTAMTGSQPNPSTGVDAKGVQTKQLKLEDICKAAGADIVETLNPFNPELEEKIKELMNKDALSVLIARFPCRMKERNKAFVPVFTPSKCVNCGACLQIDCPAVYKGEDGKICHDDFLCNGCNVCANACKFGALKKAA
ncbi:indolepyruvate ferredoxin oxidoreductase subunit alpha [Endomicrobium proavitum]|uniref:Indolepyruvate oxidoreductase subunit IorA n=1 Tax=Endomicrobium proavitum TaxID=1408281 RepID=A0A0G3WM12_9BACT|nr:indolepyruvate ferredoxin oxidoreductase subunit alpha [Endomicrobium proavitum]AKL98494.1 indolepyruvate ferredoxin oxidoreductase, alpha subunit [Endomicrobium proavitum]